MAKTPAATSPPLRDHVEKGLLYQNDGILDTPAITIPGVQYSNDDKLKEKDPRDNPG
ncbi:MAG: hypothetical protein IPP25_07720 [Saprospiraceae bacterium]|nr:hypothetical protein [Candidatus Opimibacter skivensis]